MSESWVFDSFALLALLGDEPGAEDVAQFLRRAQEGEICLLMTWVNLGEVAYIVERRWGQRRLQEVLGTLEEMALEIVSAGRELTLAAAHIKARHSLSYADAFAAALALDRAATLVTGDPEFKPLEGEISIHWLLQAA